ncbi:class I SAM-dependent methyltransferase [Actinomadura logoneensis]|uniref:Class I SAM-dependent methyltransferase n=1 Tax=Actinomadura logoneensis TaxID=2293572 RepID=A0A372JUB5_9ACTN|nr:class I SAM-dependent methyltransferase [Actinomadura logoneensis]RFU43549.1 class I SAM-dependent methyltransferase [Actinomadura logoneensis]
MPDLSEHPDRKRWNAKYEAAGEPGFLPHPLAVWALSQDVPEGPVLDLASGPSGSALRFAAEGHPVTAVDVSEVALDLLREEAEHRRLADLITPVQADLSDWLASTRQRFAIVLCTGFWDARVFGPAVAAVPSGGLVLWEAFTDRARQRRPDLPSEWCLGEGEPAALLPAGFRVVLQEELPDQAKRRFAARSA